MKALRDLSVRGKLFAGFGAVLALTITLGVVLLSQMGSINSISQTVSKSDFPTVVANGDIGQTLNDYWATVNQAIVETSPSARAGQDASAAQDAQLINRKLSGYGSLVGPGQDTTDWHEVQAGWARLKAGVAPLLTPRVTDNASTQALVTHVDNSQFTPLQNLAASWTLLNKNTAAVDAKRIDSTYNSSLVIGIALLVFAVLVGFAVAFLVARYIRRGAEEMLHAAEGIADGDIDQRLTLESKDELGRTVSAFRRMIEYLREQASVAEAVAAGDLTVEPNVRSAG